LGQFPTGCPPFNKEVHGPIKRFRQQQGRGVRKRQFRFKNQLLSLDSTTVSLCLNLFPWAQFRRAKGGVKAQVLLDHDDYLPRYVLITEARHSDVRVAQSLELNPRSIVAMDRGYNDYSLFGKWTARRIGFVTRLKDNAAYEVLHQQRGPLPPYILADEFIRLTGAQAAKDCPHILRRVVVWDPKHQRQVVLLTNLATDSGDGVIWTDNRQPKGGLQPGNRISCPQPPVFSERAAASLCSFGQQ
jgi:hypothetical protein